MGAAPVIPIIIGALAATATAATGVISYISSRQQAKAARRQAEEQARAAEENAMQARIAAQHEIYLHRRKTQYLLGKQESLYGRAGITMEGTPLAVMEDTIRQAELDAMAKTYQGEVASRRWLREADIYRQAGAATARSYQMQGWGSLIGGMSSATSSVLSSYSLLRGKSA